MAEAEGVPQVNGRGRPPSDRSRGRSPKNSLHTNYYITGAWMSGKEYLEQIGRYDVLLERLRMELKAMDADRTYIRGVDYGAARVQTSRPADAYFVDDAIRSADRARQIAARIAELSTKRQAVIDKIYSLKDARHIRVLAMHFVDGMRIDEVADVMTLSYRSVLRLIHDGLTALESVLDASGDGA